jgi:hypothetical protein
VLEAFRGSITKKAWGVESVSTKVRIDCDSQLGLDAPGYLSRCQATGASLEHDRSHWMRMHSNGGQDPSALGRLLRRSERRKVDVHRDIRNLDRHIFIGTQARVERDACLSRHHHLPTTPADSAGSSGVIRMVGSAGDRRCSMTV